MKIISENVTKWLEGLGGEFAEAEIKRTVPLKSYQDRLLNSDVMVWHLKDDALSGDVCLDLDSL